MILYSLSVTRRSTQVRLKGAVLKTARGFTPRGGSNPSSSAILLSTIAHKYWRFYRTEIVTSCNDFLFCFLYFRRMKTKKSPHATGSVRAIFYTFFRNPIVPLLYWDRSFQYAAPPRHTACLMPLLMSIRIPSIHTPL